MIVHLAAGRRATGTCDNVQETGQQCCHSAGRHPGCEAEAGAHPSPTLPLPAPESVFVSLHLKCLVDLTLILAPGARYRTNIQKSLVFLGTGVVDICRLPGAEALNALFGGDAPILPCCVSLEESVSL